MSVCGAIKSSLCRYIDPCPWQESCIVHILPQKISKPHTLTLTDTYNLNMQYTHFKYMYMYTHAKISMESVLFFNP